MGKLDENLEKNEYLSNEFKKIARKSFQEIFNMLGREGFKKWVKMQSISKDAKFLIYEWANNEEMLDNGKTGDYNCIENKIRISEGITSSKTILGVSKHECLHFLTRKGKLSFLSTYLNEGVTEYLKHLTEDENDIYSYEENVEVITFLCDFIGDSIIQTYLEGKEKYFLNDLQYILKEEIKTEDEREKEIDEFFECLDERHSYLYGEYYDEEQIENTDQKINDFFRKIILCKFRQMAKERRFNQNGCFDEELARKVISEKLKNVRFVGEEYSYMEKSEIADYILEEMKEKIILEIERNYNPKSEIMFNYEFEKSWQKKIGEDQFSIDKALSDMFEKKTQMSIIEFCDYITKLASEFSIDQNKLKELCEKYIFKCFEKPTKVEKVYELIANNIPRNNAVFNLLSKEATSTEPQFRKIGDSEYVEQRDRQFVYLKINDDGTIYQETDLNKVKDIFKISDSLESIRLINREDDYRSLGILNEQKFQQVEMVNQMINQILYQENIDLEDIVNNMNVIIEDAQFLNQLIESTLQKRTRLQVMDLINVLTKEELEQVSNEIYDAAILNSGIKDIKQEQELNEYHKKLCEYENSENDSR